MRRAIEDAWRRSSGWDTDFPSAPARIGGRRTAGPRTGDRAGSRIGTARAGRGGRGRLRRLERALRLALVALALAKRPQFRPHGEEEKKKKAREGECVVLDEEPDL